MHLLQLGQSKTMEAFTATVPCGCDWCWLHGDTGPTLVFTAAVGGLRLIAM